MSPVVRSHELPKWSGYNHPNGGWANLCACEDGRPLLYEGRNDCANAPCRFRHCKWNARGRFRKTTPYSASEPRALLMR